MKINSAKLNSIAKIIAIFASYFFVIPALSENIFQISCDLTIEKKFSEGGDPRRYYNNSIVKVIDDPSRKSIELDGLNFSLHLDTSKNYILNSRANFLDDQWRIDWASKNNNGRISINRLTGDLFAEQFFEDSAGWMKTLVSGPCRKIDLSQRKF